ncbi:nuclear transport factor 2 family protein [Nonomuraea jabiensis]|uniref:nuclear transport factor 2 family protein n=1 Tax=Nonomuraea jabiensis TaxID=882448 RepID=UPI003D765337
MSPREVVGHLLKLTATGPTETMADLFAEDAVFEMPFLPPGVNAHEVGRETSRAHLAPAVGGRSSPASTGSPSTRRPTPGSSSPSTGCTGG